MAASTVSKNVASAVMPWATGTSPASLGRGRSGAGNGSASRLAIISSVTVPSSAAGIASGTAAGAGGTATGKGVHKVTVQTPRAMVPITTVTPSQASRSRPVSTKPSQTTSPVRAALAWPNTTVGGTPTPVARCRRRPPRITQVRSM
jgi:hypothetical protein